MPFLDNLGWRYATKKYNGDPVSQGDILRITDAIRMAPSSAGAQPYHIIVTSGELKDRLITSSGQLDKIGCSHLFVFCTRTDYPERADKQIQIAAEIQGKTVEELAGLRRSVDSTVAGRSREDLREWAARQTYIALGFGLAACAELRIDSSPMEGFKPEEFHSILQLPDYIQPVVIMAIGHRDENDPAQPFYRPKVRFPKDDLFDFR